jgi:ribosomal protein S18 acetylase RimI-like enzyme
MKSTDILIRTGIIPEDIDHVRSITCSSGYFRNDEVDIAVELAQDAIDKGIQSGYTFIFADTDRITVGYACFGPIPCTRGSFDLYWIAVDQQYRGLGIGGKLLAEVEHQVGKMNGRNIYIETSSGSQYADTCAFYLKNGYILASRLKDFYSLGDDKLTYVKVLKIQI